GSGRELPPRGEGTARPERRREADEEALAMVQRQGGGDRLALLDPGQLGEADPAHGEAQVPDDCGLRVAGCPRGVDVEEDVASADVGDVGGGGGGRTQVVEGPHAGW